MIAHAELTILELHYDQLVAHLFRRRDVETAALLRCGIAEMDDSVRLLVRQVIPVRNDHYLRRDDSGLSIDSAAYAPVLKAAAFRNDAVVLVHTHPCGPLGFSPQDDREERRFFPCVHTRIPARPHSSLVFVAPDQVVGRVWHRDGASAPLRRINVVGSRFRVLGTDEAGIQAPAFFDRQVRAFGHEIQRLLRCLRIGIVGAGGTGSAVFDQLLRLGVGKLLVIDPDNIEQSNLSRVYESRSADIGRPKVMVAARTAREAGLPSIVEVLHGGITQEKIARRLRECDVVFGCTDLHLPRAIQSRLSTRYLIPVFDLGVVIDSVDGQIRAVAGRVTTVLPGTSCLLCRGRIDPQRIRAESLSPVERQMQAAEGYIPELGLGDPAVIPFTTAVASFAVGDLLHRLTGFMGSRRSSETLLLFHVPEVRSNSVPPEAWCDCAQATSWGYGDQQPFLGMTWP
jgi:molybdopterin/thiamine biosynthesis adenylyltransferase